MSENILYNKISSIGGGRIAFLDYSRVFAALLVIYGHVLPYDNYIPRIFIYSFHMPFFFIVSGMLHKYKGCINFRKYIKALIVPALSFNVIVWLISVPLFYYGIWDYEMRYNMPLPSSIWELYVQTAIKAVYGFAGGHSGMPSGPCWFLIALFYCKIGTDMLRKYGFKKMLPLAAIVVLIVFLVHKNLFCIGNAIMAAPFFLFGHYFGPKIISVTESMKVSVKLVMSMVFLCVTIALTILNGQVSMWGLSYGQKFPLPVSFLLFHANAFAGSFMLLLFFSIFKKSVQFVTSMANSLITILGIQILFIYVSWYNLPMLTTPLYGFLLSVVFLFGCYGIHIVIKRYIPFVLGK